jgi:uncharacterized protein YdeI (YjbR/CyaY-like superfamily)
VEATFFTNQQDFRSWLEQHHTSESELTVGFYKVASGKPSMTWSESVDQALCFGWIDGVRHTLDHERYCIRFTPRKPNSIWSAANLAKVESLMQAKLMTPAGMKAFASRKEANTRRYSFENEAKDLSVDLADRFKTEAEAWAFFMNQVPSYRKVIIHWVMTAKQEKTKLARLEKVIAASLLRKRLE